MVGARLERRDSSERNVASRYSHLLLSARDVYRGECVPLGKLIWSSRSVNSHRAGGGRNRPHPVTRHRNTGCCSERVAHFLCGLHDPLWLCRAHYVLARISSKCRCAECQREPLAHRTEARPCQLIVIGHSCGSVKARCVPHALPEISDRLCAPTDH